VRAFLRFLGAQGYCEAWLEHAIPTLHGWPEASPPEHLTPTEVERVIASCDESSAIGLRNRAILLFLARLGLRASDVVSLRLDDMDWPDGSFIVSGKTSREVRLPLPQEVGDALLCYLPRRPDVNADVVFVRHKAPLGPLTPTSVSFIAAEAVGRAGVKTKFRGAHLLRRTAATHMLRQGVPLSQIGAVLRHRSQDMTAHYAKVDFDLLHEVVQPWPEKPSC
jgi:integrase